MPFNTTDIFFKNQAALSNTAKRIAINEGGTSSSKTFSIIQLLIWICLQIKKPLLVSIVSESLPHLKLGCMRDFRNIMGELWNDKKWNASDHFYKFSSDVIIEFFSADQPGKARGPRRDILFVNEANNIPKPIYDELDMRTRRFVFADFNPVCEFWMHELKNRPDVEWIHSTYLDARHVLPEAVVQKIESKKDSDPNWWRVYGLGLVGKIEGLIHHAFDTVVEWPEHGGISGYGLDFGYNDPCVLVRNKIIGEHLVSDEVIYQSGLTNLDLSIKMELAGLKKGNDEIIADCAEPKSIEELYRMGWNIKPAIKGADSIVAGIQKVNQYKQVWTKRSANCIKEQRNYMWMRDKNDRILDTPASNGFDHGMDARRYWLARVKLGPAQGQALRIAI